jgi:putative endonuclease
VNFYIYILYSPYFKRTYTGQTNNLEDRLELHNSGKVRSTRSFVPWIKIHSESFFSRAEAMRREKRFKYKSGRKKISDILNDYLKTHPS